MNWQETVTKQLRRHEGERAKPYVDIEGKTTIGIGRCLDTKPLTYEEWQTLFPYGLTKAQIDYLFQHDLADAIDDAEQAVGKTVFDALSDNRKIVLTNMAFNLGLPRLRKFSKMLAAVRDGRWLDAQAEALNSRWAQQVGPRAVELAALLVTG